MSIICPPFPVLFHANLPVSLECSVLKPTIAILLGITLVAVTILAIVHFLGYPVKTAHAVFTLTNFWVLLVLVIRSLNSVNQMVLGKETPRVFKLSLLQEAVLMLVKEEAFWVEFGAGALLSLLL